MYLIALASCILSKMIPIDAVMDPINHHTMHCKTASLAAPLTLKIVVIIAQTMCFDEILYV